MKDKNIIKAYIANFRRHISSSLKPGYGLKATGVLSKEGGVVRFVFSNRSENSDEIFKSVETVGDAFKTLGLQSFGDAKGVTFSGTNMVLESNGIYIIKGGQDELWTDSAAKEDVHKILHPPRGSKE